MLLQLAQSRTYCEKNEVKDIHNVSFPKYSDASPLASELCILFQV